MITHDDHLLMKQDTLLRSMRASRSWSAALTEARRTQRVCTRVAEMGIRAPSTGNRTFVTNSRHPSEI